MTTSPTPHVAMEPVTVVLDPRVAYAGFGPDDGDLAAAAGTFDITDAIDDLADAAEQLDFAYGRVWKDAAQRIAPGIDWDVRTTYHQPPAEQPLKPRIADASDGRVDQPLLDRISDAITITCRETDDGRTRWTIHDGNRDAATASIPWTLDTVNRRRVADLAARIADGEPLRTVEHDGLALRLFESVGDTATTATIAPNDALGYVLTDHGEVIFAGTDFRPSPLHATDSDRTVEAIAGFLVLRPGDTDDESNYTGRQRDWVSNDGPDRLQELIAELPGDTEYARMLRDDVVAEAGPVRVWRVKPADRTDLPAVNLLADSGGNATAQYPAYVSAWLDDTGRDIDIDDDLFPGLSAEPNDDAIYDGQPVLSRMRGQQTLNWAVQHVNHWHTEAYIAVENLSPRRDLDIPATGTATVAIRNAHAAAHAGARVEAHNRSHITALADSHVEVYPGACVDRRPGSRVELADTATHHGPHRDVAAQQVDGSRGREAATFAR